MAFFFFFIFTLKTVLGGSTSYLDRFDPYLKDPSTFPKFQVWIVCVRVCVCFVSEVSSPTYSCMPLSFKMILCNVILLLELVDEVYTFRLLKFCLPICLSVRWFMFCLQYSCLLFCLLIKSSVETFACLYTCASIVSSPLVILKKICFSTPQQSTLLSITFSSRELEYIYTFCIQSVRPMSLLENS